METLEKQFKGKLKVLAVSNQDRVTLEKFFSGKNGQRYKGVVSVTGDKILHQLFPHVGVPYIVWIKDGKVINTTDAEQVNENTVGEVLKGEASSLQTVIQIGREKPLMLSENFSLEKDTSYALCFLLKRPNQSYRLWFRLPLEKENSLRQAVYQFFADGNL